MSRPMEEDVNNFDFMINQRESDDEESAPQPQGGGKRARGNSWKPDDDIRLASAWLNQRVNPIQLGNAMKGGHFWADVARVYNETCEKGGEKTRKQCKDRWNRYNPLVVKFEEYYAQARKMQESSGTNDVDAVTMAEMFYSQQEGTRFTLKQWWIKVRDQQEWRKLLEHNEPNKRTNKRTKIDEIGSYASHSRDGFNGNEVHDVRPISQIAAKMPTRAAKASKTSKNVASAPNYLEAFEITVPEKNNEGLERVGEIQLEIARANLAAKELEKAVKEIEKATREIEKATKETELKNTLWTRYNALMDKDRSNFTPREEEQWEKQVQLLEKKLEL